MGQKEPPELRVAPDFLDQDVPLIGMLLDLEALFPNQISRPPRLRA